ncbi:MAG: hypothetical protein NVS1B7_6730 [Candidatus Saccharimonadales bacterium]
MTKISELNQLHIETVQSVTDMSPLALMASDLLMRNQIVILDRLPPHVYNDLPEDIRALNEAAMRAAQPLVTPAPEDTIKYQHETNQQFAYRRLRTPMVELQAAFSTHNFDSNNDAHVIAAKTALQLGGLAFTLILDHTQVIPEVASSVGYFTSNTQAAARDVRRQQAARSSSQNYSSN